MNVLVTGGAGFLGRAVVGVLRAGGHRVAIFNRSRAPDLAAAGVECLAGDIADAGAVRAACRGRDAVVHTAARAGPGLYRPDFVAANVHGTRNVLDGCRRAGVGMLVHTSSPSVVHAGVDLIGADESLPYPDRYPAPYPETKAAAERMVLAADGDGLRCIALRPHLIWGPGDNHLLPRLIARNRAGRLRLPAPEKCIDTVYIDNAAEAHRLALDNLAGDASAAGQAFFITNGEPRPVAEVMRALLEAAGETPRIGRVAPVLAHFAARVVEMPWRALRLRADPPVSRFIVEHLATAHHFNPDRARRLLGYFPRIGFDEGLRRLRGATLPNHD